MKNTLIFVFLIYTTAIAYGDDVVELSSPLASTDPVVGKCYEQAMSAAVEGKKLCKNLLGNDYWVCSQSKEPRLKSLEKCNVMATDAKDQAAMLYLLGLLHQDFRYQANDRKCPQFFRYQEGSAVCVYTNDHFKNLMKEFPSSKYADMAAYKRAGEYYRYYECEGQILCSIENQIAGWVHFLKKRPTSVYAPEAIGKIAEALNKLSDFELDPRWESADGLLKDIETLNMVATKVSPESRGKFIAGLEKAKLILLKFREGQKGKSQ